MQTTSNYSLKKPELNDAIDIQNFNDNADIIDLQIKSLNDSSDDLKKNLQDVKTNIQDVKTSIQNIQQNNPHKLLVQDSDPGTKAIVGDAWIDLTNNVFKVKLSDGSWKIIGAAYN